MRVIGIGSSHPVLCKALFGNFRSGVLFTFFLEKYFVQLESPGVDRYWEKTHVAPRTQPYIRVAVVVRSKYLNLSGGAIDRHWANNHTSSALAVIVGNLGKKYTLFCLFTRTSGIASIERKYPSVTTWRWVVVGGPKIWSAHKSVHAECKDDSVSECRADTWRL